MNGAFYVGAAGLRAQEFATEVTANNVANWNTPGFKRARVRFSEVLAAPGQTTDPAMQLPAFLGVTVDAARRVMTPGELRATDNPLDLAIDGEGFIEVLGHDGEDALWRGGRLQLDERNRLSTDTGLVLKGVIAMPDGAEDVVIDRQGRVSALLDGARREIGRIDVARVRNPSDLRAIGDGVFRAGPDNRVTTVTPGEDGAGTLAQGFEEGSNVRLSDEMVTLLLTQRAFAANAQIVQAADQLMAIANGLKR